VNEQLQTRLSAALSQHNARLDENQRAADAVLKTASEVAAHFERVRDTIIVPALNGVAELAQAQGFRCEVQPKNQEVIFTIKDKRTTLAMAPGTRPLLAFTHSNGRVFVSAAARQRLGEPASCPIGEVTNEFVEQQAIEFVEAALKDSEKRI
jgi:hypothetical protein